VEMLYGERKRLPSFSRNFAYSSRANWLFPCTTALIAGSDFATGFWSAAMLTPARKTANRVRHEIDKNLLHMVRLRKVGWCFSLGHSIDGWERERDWLLMANSQAATLSALHSGVGSTSGLDCNHSKAEIAEPISRIEGVAICGSAVIAEIAPAAAA